MRIYPVNNNIGNNYKLTNNSHHLSYMSSNIGIKDHISFKSTESLAIGWVLKGGYSILKGATKKAAYKEEIGRNIARAEKLRNAGASISDTLFALAKTPTSEEPKHNLVYFLYDNFHVFSLKELKDYSIKKLFPLATECREDANFSHAAKVALLRNMIDTGEYVDSAYFYKAFKDLPPEYDKDKESLVIQLLKDKNARDNYIANNKRTNADVLTYKKYMADAALIRSLPMERHGDFFRDYAQSIDSVYDYSFPYIIKMLTNKTEDGSQYAPLAGDRNLFYGFYKNGFVQPESDYLVHNQQYYKTLYPKGFDVYTQALFCDTFFNLMGIYKDTPEKGAADLHIDRWLFDDMLKDYNTLIEAQTKSEEEQIELFKERIYQKQSGTSYEIIDSIPGFMYLTGKADKLKKYTESDVLTNLNLEALVSRKPNYNYNEFDIIDVKELEETTAKIEREEKEREDWLNNLSYSERAELEAPWNVP